MTRQEAVGLIVTSPVMRPTSWNSSYISLYFWLLKALMGLVKITLCLSLSARAIAYLRKEKAKPQTSASGPLLCQREDCRLYTCRIHTYSAHTVFPADVWADTSTDWLLSMQRMASRWNGSSTNGYSWKKQTNQVRTKVILTCIKKKAMSGLSHLSCFSNPWF